MTAPAVGTYGRSRFVVGQPLPAILMLKDLAAVPGLGTTQAWTLERRHELAFLEVTPRLGKRARYSGKLVQAWIDGVDPATETRSFGGARRRRS